MIVLGIDPGNARMGYGVIQTNGASCACVDYGCLETNISASAQERLFSLDRELAALIRTHVPDVIVMESVFFFKNLKTAVRVIQAQGIILLCAQRKNIPVIEYTPPQIKVAVTGYGKATKQQVQKAVQQALSLPGPPKPDDAADALAASLCHHWHSRLNKWTKRP